MEAAPMILPHVPCRIHLPGRFLAAEKDSARVDVHYPIPVLRA
jgi:hypothetical protein